MRRNFSSSRLVRLLGRWDATNAQAPRQDVAERMGQWLPVRGAITLDAAHRSIQALPARWAVPRGHALAPGDALVQEVQRVREALVQAVMAAPAPPTLARRGRHALPLPEGPAPPAAEPTAEAAFAPYRQRCLDLQQLMELRTDALRVHVRRQLAARGPELAQLAALDAVMEQMFAERTRKALSALPALVERRCVQSGAAGSHDLQAWGRELQDMLLAELETRLEPVVGLMEAGSRHRGGGEGMQR